jgi:splicing factor U2AF subunit
VVDNVGCHIIGHVYAKFSNEEEAADALNNVQGNYYDGTLLDCEYSPVTDFHQARCGKYDEGRCSSANVCNFLHVEAVPAALIRSLEDDAEAQRRSLMTVCTVQLGTPRSA